MKKKIISMLTVAAMLVSSVSVVSFASGDSWGKNKPKDVQTSQKSDKDDEKKVTTVTGSVYKDDEKKVTTVTDSVYKDEDEDQDKDKEDNEHKGKGQINKAQLETATVAIATYGTQTPAEVVDTLLSQNIPLSTIIRALDRVSENHGDKYPALSDSALKAYSEAVTAKIEAQKAALQERIDALEALTDLYDKMGDLEKAINAQKKAIKSDYKNILSYKKLGEVFNKKGDKDIKVFTVGEQVYFKDVQPVIQSDRTLIPIRAISESLKADVKWDEATKTVTITKDGTEIKLVLGSDTATINGQAVKLDVPAETIKDRTMVPVRFISEAFKSTVEWEPTYQIVIIY